MAMNKAEKQVAAESLRSEATVIRQLRENYKEASANIAEKLKALSEREQTQAVIWQEQYQVALKAQLDVAINSLNSKNYTNVLDYLKHEYEIGFIGTMHGLQQMGIPLLIPIDQKAVAKMVETTGDNIKLSKKLYGNTTKLKNAVRRSVSIGLASGESYQDIAGRLSREMCVDYNKTVRIARTEGHRVNQSSSYDAALKSRDNGADLVKQWDATLDGRTRAEHRARDGEIRELDEPYSGGGQAPGMFGRPWEDINCRCVSLVRPRWAVEGESEGFDKYTKYSRYGNMTEEKYKTWKSGLNVDGEMKHGGLIADMSDAKNFNEFVNRYKAVTETAKIGVEVMGGAVDTIEFKPADTVKGAASFTSDTLGIPKADFKGLDVEAANEMNKSLTYHFNRFPELKDNFGFIGSSQNANKLRKELWEKYYYDDITSKMPWVDDKQAKATAKRRASARIGKTPANVSAWSYSPDKDAVDYAIRGITANKNMYKNGFDRERQKKNDEYMLKTKWHPENTVGLKSVFDHELGHQLDALLDIQNDPEFKEYIRKFFVNGDSRLAEKEKIKDALSEYAATNTKEFVAEAWSEYLNNPQPRDVAKFIGQLIEKKYAKLHGVKG